MKGGRRKGQILVVGPLPPPPFGVATSFGYLKELAEREGLPLVFLDIADRRGTANIGKFEPGNVGLALRHGVEFLWKLVKHRPRVVYVSLSQGRLGFLRDCLFLTPARLTRRRVVVHLHGGFFRRFYESESWWFRALIRWQLGGVARAVVLAERFRDVFDGLVPRDRVRVVPNGVAAESLATSNHRGPGAGSGGPDPDGIGEIRVLYLGAVCKEKGVLDLLDAMGELRERAPGVRLTLAGENYPSEEKAVRRAIEDNGLEGLVDRPGIVQGDAKQRALRDADVFVFPSRNPIGEGQPFVLLEAMAAGLPIVTTDIGAAAETVADGEAGLVVPPADPGALAAALGEVAGSPAKRRELGRAGLDRVRTEYSLGAWRDAMLALFSEVAED